MATFTELLPATKCEKHGVMTWTPAVDTGRDPRESSGAPVVEPPQPNRRAPRDRRTSTDRSARGRQSGNRGRVARKRDGGSHQRPTEARRGELTASEDESTTAGTSPRLFSSLVRGAVLPNAPSAVVPHFLLYCCIGRVRLQSGFPVANSWNCRRFATRLGGRLVPVWNEDGPSCFRGPCCVLPEAKQKKVLVTRVTTFLRPRLSSRK